MADVVVMASASSPDPASRSSPARHFRAAGRQGRFPAEPLFPDARAKIPAADVDPGVPCVSEWCGPEKRARTKGSPMAQYMVLIYEDEAQYATATPELNGE